MKVVEDALFAACPRGLVATIGNYDGIHRGQQHALDVVQSRAQEEGLPAAVITFDPHPLTVLRPQQPVQCLTTSRQKVEQLEKVVATTLLNSAFMKASYPRYDQERSVS